MPTLVTLAIVIISGVLLLAGLVGCSKSNGAEQPVPASTVEQSVTADHVASLSAEGLRQRLADLEKAPPPVAKMGAMCYKPIGMPDQQEYICPKCGEKTLYAQSDEKDGQVLWQLSKLADCRREVKSFPKSDDVTIALDESEFCSHCSPDAESPALVLVVKYKDGRTHRTSSVNTTDLRMLRDFLRGEKSYETFNEGSQPLKEYVPRLREMLGLAEEDETDDSP